MNPALRFLTAQHWAILPGVMDQIVALVDRHDAGERSAPEAVEQMRADAAARRAAAGLPELMDASEQGPTMTVQNGTAVVEVRGVLARYSSQVNGACQDQGRSAESLQSDLSAAAADPGVSRVVLRIDSPGGQVAGTAETAALIAGIRAMGKPVTAYIDGMAASAAYWLASQADEIVASAPTALAGSIGVLQGHVDQSKAQEGKGLKVRIFRSTPLKAPGAAGGPLDDEQAASIQRMVDGLHQAFAGAVIDARGLTGEQAKRATNGELFTANDAMALGLVDRVASFADVLSSPGVSSQRRSTHAADALPSPSLAQPNKDQPMKTAELTALILAHPGHSEFIAKEADKDGATVAGIKDAIAARDRSDAMAALTADLTAARAKVDALTAEKATATGAVAALTSERDGLKAENARLLALIAGGKAGAAVQPDGTATAPLTITKADFDALRPREQAAKMKAGYTIQG